MNRNFQYRDVNEALPYLMRVLLSEGDKVMSRNGETREMTHVGITLTEPKDREILVPERKASPAAQVAETMWVLAGRNDVDWLSKYLPRATDYSDDGVVWRGGYGPRLRNWNGIDQVEHVVRMLTDDSLNRQAVIAVYNPEVDTKPGKDIPCNDFLMFTCREGVLDLQVVIRSNDALWGWSGINQFEWSVLQELVAHLIGVQQGSLHFSVASFHVYDYHMAKADKIASSPSSLFYLNEPSPALNMNVVGQSLTAWDELTQMWFALEADIRSGSWNESHVANFPEPMLRSWLQVLEWWWTGDQMFLSPLKGTNLFEACMVGIQPSKREQRFLDYVSRLHADKDAAYGDSWKRRGEMLGILANIARKVDRIDAGTSTADENQVDTAIDAMVYCAKYRWWLYDEGRATNPADYTVSDDSVDRVDALLELVATQPPLAKFVPAEAFAEVEERVIKGEPVAEIVDIMLVGFYHMALRLW